MERLTKRDKDGCAYVIHRYTRQYGEIADKLAAYEDAEEQGLLPKFHLGDEFWTIRLGKVLKSKIVMLQQKKDGTWQYRMSREIKSEYHDTDNYKESNLNKSFFLTREEAGAALERMNEKENGNE